jgi:adenosylhomocysteinase
MLPEVMALSFANQLLSILHITKNHDEMEVIVHNVTDKIDLSVARYGLDSMDIKIDEMTFEQERYSQSS